MQELEEEDKLEKPDREIPNTQEEEKDQEEDATKNAEEARGEEVDSLSSNKSQELAGGDEYYDFYLSSSRLEQAALPERATETLPLASSRFTLPHHHPIPFMSNPYLFPVD